MSSRFGGLLLLLSAFCLLPCAQAQDKRGADGFLLAMPGYEFAFPRDHGAHEEYRTEWWYYTGHLTTAAGKRFGFEVTFFQVGIVRPDTPRQTEWDLRHLALAHFAVTDVDGRRFRYYEKLSRSSPYTASAKTAYLDVFNEGWRVSTVNDGSWRLVAASGEDSIDLTLRTRKPPAIHGSNGISVKAPAEGFASHYYSMTRLEVSGRINGQDCRGLAWMDHEFGSAALRENQQGWDWFSIQLDNDTELMLYIIRTAGGAPDVTSSGSVITAAGDVHPVSRDQMRVTARDKWTSKRSGATYPMRWRIEIPAMRIRLDLEPFLLDQELVTKNSTQVTYWEGAVAVNGSFNRVAVKGKGYVEMTGYDKRVIAP